MIDATLLLAWLLDELAPADQARVEAAVQASPELRAEAQALAELIGEAVAAGTEAVAPAPAGRDRLLAAAAPRPRLAGFIDRVAAFVGVTLERAAALLASVDAPDRFAPSPWPGIGLFHIEPGPAFAGAEVGFVRMAPGTVFPHHGHGGTEINLILQGGLQLDDGTVLGPGDEYGGEPGVEHHFTALPGPDLILVAVLRGDLVFPPAEG
ncbi:MAG: cupin domain-containing protein [bacterium]